MELSMLTISYITVFVSLILLHKIIIQEFKQIRKTLIDDENDEILYIFLILIIIVIVTIPYYNVLVPLYFLLKLLVHKKYL